MPHQVYVVRERVLNFVKHPYLECIQINMDNGNTVLVITGFTKCHDAFRPDLPTYSEEFSMNTEIIFVLDKSGSMSSIHSNGAEGTNAFVDSQREVAGAARFVDRVQLFAQHQKRAAWALPLRACRP